MLIILHWAHRVVTYQSLKVSSLSLSETASTEILPWDSVIQLHLVPLRLGTRLFCNYIKMLSCLLSSEDKPRLTLVPRRTGNETRLLERGVSTFAGLEECTSGRHWAIDRPERSGNVAWGLRVHTCELRWPCIICETWEACITFATSSTNCEWRQCLPVIHVVFLSHKCRLM